jgi:hypothetical protein
MVRGIIQGMERESDVLAKCLVFCQLHRCVRSCMAVNPQLDEAGPHLVTTTNSTFAQLLWRLRVLYESVTAAVPTTY